MNLKLIMALDIEFISVKRVTCGYSCGGDKELFLIALRDVAKAYKLPQLADKASLGRESMYKSLSRSGNPKLSTINSLLDAMGLKLAVTVKH